MMIACIFIPLITCLSLSIGIATFSIVQNNQRNIIGSSTLGVLQLTDSYFSNRLSDAIGMLISIYNSSSLESALSEIGEYGSISPSTYLLLQNQLNNYFSRNYSMIEAIGICFELSESFLYKSYNHVNTISYQWDSVSDLKPGSFRLCWRDMSTDSSFIDDRKPGSTIGIYLECNSSDSGHYAICMDIREDFITESFDNLLITSPLDILIIGNERFYALKQDDGIDAGEIVQAIRNRDDKLGTIMVEDTFAIYDRMPINEWYIAVIFNDSQLFEGLAPVRNVIILMVVLIGGFAVLLAVLFSVIISKPVRNLSNAVSAIDTDNINKASIMQIPTNFYEISILQDSINNLLERIKLLFSDIEKRQAENLRIQSSLLLSQINPHFLYNMLYAIGQECRLGETDEASDMLYELSSFFRLGLNSGKEVVSLEDEKEHVLSYLKLISRSFVYGLSWKVNISDDLLNLLIPRMTLQPIVENCYKHGLKAKREPGLICISAERNDKGLLISISDNGNGICESKLKEINEAIEDGDYSKGFGLYNVSQRLKNFFGPDSFLSVESSSGIGTTVNIQIEYNDNEEVIHE